MAAAENAVESAEKCLMADSLQPFLRPFIA
jgi:hypothetical protein